MRKIFRIFKILALILTVLAVFQIIVSNQLATAGGKLAEIDQEIKLLEEENEYLKREIAISSSLTTIAEKAEKAGYLETNNFLYLTEEPFAFKNSH